MSNFKYRLRYLNQFFNSNFKHVLFLDHRLPTKLELKQYSKFIINDIPYLNDCLTCTNRTVLNNCSIKDNACIDNIDINCSFKDTFLLCSKCANYNNNICNVNGNIKIVRKFEKCDFFMLKEN